MEQIIIKFIDVLGQPETIGDLEQYVKFCLESNNQHHGKFQTHHILPRCKFPEHLNDSWNLVDLTLDAHITAHHLLIRAYPIPSFIKPLNYMVPRTEDEIIALRDARSKSTTRFWERLRKDPEAYRAKIQATKDWHAKNNLPGMPFYEGNCARRIARYQDDKVKSKISKGLFDWWASRTPEDLESIRRIRQASWTPARLEKHLTMLSARYADAEYMAFFKSIMQTVNKDPAKRAAAGESLKVRWTEDEYREKTLNARREADAARKAAGLKRGNSTKMQENWANPEWRQMMLDSRKASRDAKKKAKDETNQS